MGGGNRPDRELSEVETSRLAWVDIGSGQEAQAFRGKISDIEGVGGVLHAPKPVDAVKRVNWCKTGGEKVYFKNAVLSILDEYHVRSGNYTYPHIPDPLGSFEGGYYYRFVEGNEGFPNSLQNDSNRYEPVEKKEWNRFVGLFNMAGFGVNHDVSDADDARSGKNIIMGEFNFGSVYETFTLPKEWKRIDFGTMSCPGNPDEFSSYIRENDVELGKTMGYKHDLLKLAGKKVFTPEDMSPDEKAQLNILTLKYRREKLGLT
jgi:hypothetical protein